MRIARVYACIFTHILNTYAILIYIYIYLGSQYNILPRDKFYIQTGFTCEPFFRRPAVYIIYTLVSPIDANNIKIKKLTHWHIHITYNTYMAIYIIYIIYIGTYNFHISHKYTTLYTHILMRSYRSCFFFLNTAVITTHAPRRFELHVCIMYTL